MTSHTYTMFAPQNTSAPTRGEIRVGTYLLNSTTPDLISCHKLCQTYAGCHFITYDNNTAYDVKHCTLKGLEPAPGTVLAFRNNPRSLNYHPLTMGRFDVIGSTGIVTIHATLMVNNKILYTARPEYNRGAPNKEVVVRDSVPYGEIGTVFDPVTGVMTPLQVNDNIFCHGALLLQDGRVFQAGGDDTNDIARAGQGFVYGIKNTRTYDYRTDQWTQGVDMQAQRWYPSVVRLVDGTVFIIGGSHDGAGVPECSLEIWTPGAAATVLVPSRLISDTGTAGYPKVYLIPHTGDVFLFTYRQWAVLDQKTAAEKERFVWNANEEFLSRGRRSGAMIAGNVLLPLSAKNNYKAVLALFGGGDNENNRTGLNDVAFIEITAATGQKVWSYDDELMPYGRLVSDAILQPNGKILIFNGGRQGQTGGTMVANTVVVPYLNASASDCFCYDPEAPQGKRFSLFAASPIQRFYHSAAMLLPDGRTLITGSEQNTFYYPSAYEHRAEAFTPPWLLDGTPRPVIVSVPTDFIPYNTQFAVKFTGSVSKVSILTPGSTTHGTEFTQRMLYPTIISQTSDTLVLLSPPDATIMLQGYHMLYLVNGDTPSVSSWIQFGDGRPM